ncbi:hypothetical protein TIFTF001_045190 [Ficus carica]|uniref:Uncharacterized protein n=1 Tax=Ficus carica TaxID=3494 RepID=A0AA87YNX2_FICCA|nr:hypothetical protein TIFTF001_045190 [Ficus carica]
MNEASCSVLTGTARVGHSGQGVCLEYVMLGYDV